MRDITGDCKAKKDAPLWMTYSLEPKPDGVVAGTRWEIFANETCMGSRTVTMKRTGDANPAVAVADPEGTPPRTASPAAGLHGRYRFEFVDRATGETTSDVFYDVDTSCLHSVDVGPCPLTMDLDATVERIGDARPI